MKLSGRILWLAVMSLVCGRSVNAQDCIYGRVIDAERTPLAGISCVLLNIPDSVLIAGTTSDMEGLFELEFKEDKEYNPLAELKTGLKKT